MRMALLCIVLVLGCASFGSSEVSDVLTIDERDKLVNQMSNEVSALLAQKKIPTADGQHAASGVLQSLLIDPPLKTKEEIDQIGQGCLGFNELSPKELRRSVAEGLHASDGNGLPLPTVTFELACDLRRLSHLGAILDEAKLKSPALDALTQKAIAMVRSMKEL